ncbi:hypothetical protein AK812_SmicGene10397 [Symbiodinium microadriaticum]|uniref:Uncharacterized protein n=1 Tax=Symbiodinium microadriaticum TaxID=2951 RepID=A0A1Q9EFV4_SYMMI|nr:hypothetical protein AK812_SmicGene10397 [Symbiodinium microadriaticum]
MMVDELQKSFKAAEEILEQKRRQVLQAEKAAERERDRLALEWAWLRSQREVLTQERDAIHKMQVVLEAKHHALEEEREACTYISRIGLIIEEKDGVVVPTHHQPLPWTWTSPAKQGGFEIA